VLVPVERSRLCGLPQAFQPANHHRVELLLQYRIAMETGVGPREEPQEGPTRA
jgi:hypothetical protein